MSTEEQLNQTGQLSVRQLAVYHTAMQVKKILTHRQPEYLFRRLTGKEKTNTHRYLLRQKTRENRVEEIQLPDTRSSLLCKSFLYRGGEEYNKLPKELRDEPLKSFKKQIRIWVKENIPIYS